MTASLRQTAAAGEARLVADLRPFAFSIAREYSWPGATADDVRQEALLGLLFGIRTFRPGGGASLRNHVGLAVRRQLWTAIKTATRDKHRPLNDAVTAGVDESGEDVAVIELFADPAADVHRVAAGREQLARTVLCVRAMPPLEREAVRRAVNRLPYRGEKNIDNALQRARRKINALEEAA